MTTDLERLRADPRSTAELLEAAIGEWDRGETVYTHGYGPAAVLHARATAEILDAALTLCRDERPSRRALGAHLLGQLGEPRSFPEACADALIGLLTGDREPEVLASAAFAAGHLRNRRVDPALIGLRLHPFDRLRFGVAFGLNGATSPEAIDALLVLMRDTDEQARDWATTGIAAHAPLDDARVHEALWQASTDSSRFIRAEALYGLARRGDRRIVQRLIAELSKGDARRQESFHEAALTLLGRDKDESAETADLVSELHRSLIVH